MEKDKEIERSPITKKKTRKKTKETQYTAQRNVVTCPNCHCVFHMRQKTDTHRNITTTTPTGSSSRFDHFNGFMPNMNVLSKSEDSSSSNFDKNDVKPTFALPGQTDAGLVSEQQEKIRSGVIARSGSRVKTMVRDYERASNACLEGDGVHFKKIRQYQNNFGTNVEKLDTAVRPTDAVDRNPDPSALVGNVMEPPTVRAKKKRRKHRVVKKSHSDFASRSKNIIDEDVVDFGRTIETTLSEPPTPRVDANLFGMVKPTSRPNIASIKTVASPVLEITLKTFDHALFLDYFENVVKTATNLKKKITSISPRMIFNSNPNRDALFLNKGAQSNTAPVIRISKSNTDLLDTNDKSPRFGDKEDFVKNRKRAIPRELLMSFGVDHDLLGHVLSYYRGERCETMFNMLVVVYKSMNSYLNNKIESGEKIKVCTQPSRKY